MTVPVHLRRHGLAPAPELAVLREKLPVGRLTLANGSKVWLVSGYRLVREVLGAPERFGSADGATEDSVVHAATRRHGVIVACDPPEHTRLRRLLAAAFTSRRTAALRPVIEAVVRDALDAIETKGPPAELVHDFALTVPLQVICALLGVPFADRADFTRRAAQRLDTSLDADLRTRIMQESLEYMRDLVQRLRREPNDGLLSAVLQQHGAEIGDQELAGLGDTLLLAGHDTTANVLALGVFVLLTQPEHRAAATDPVRLPGLVEELIRHLSVVQTGAPRYARVDTELGGQRIAKGDPVLCSLPSANQDHELAPDAAFFDPDRARLPHVAFGHGIHHCIGAQLSKLELQVAFPALFQRFPELEPAGEPRFRQASNVHGLISLPVTWAAS